MVRCNVGEISHQKVERQDFLFKTKQWNPIKYFLESRIIDLNDVLKVYAFPFNKFKTDRWSRAWETMTMDPARCFAPCMRMRWHNGPGQTQILCSGQLNKGNLVRTPLKAFSQKKMMWGLSQSMPVIGIRGGSNISMDLWIQSFKFFYLVCDC